MNKVKVIAEIVLFVVDAGVLAYKKIKEAKIFRRKKKACEKEDVSNG